MKPPTAIRTLLAVAGLLVCQACTSPPGTPLPPQADCSADVWMAGDSISWATAARIEHVFSTGVGGAGYTTTNNIGDHLRLALQGCASTPADLLLLGGVNDIAVGASVEDTSAARAALVTEMEGLGISVWIVTQPFWGYTEVAELNLQADVVIPPAYWGTTADGIHPLTFDLYAGRVEQELYSLGVL